MSWFVVCGSVRREVVGGCFPGEEEEEEGEASALVFVCLTFALSVLYDSLDCSPATILY